MQLAASNVKLSAVSVCHAPSEGALLNRCDTLLPLLLKRCSQHSEHTYCKRFLSGMRMRVSAGLMAAPTAQLDRGVL